LADFGAVVVVARIGDGIDLSDGVRRVLYADTTLNHDVIVTGLRERHRTISLRVTTVYKVDAASLCLPPSAYAPHA